jgi:Arc/MetJ-type ribon-helix-helix transcriptional regulator
MTVNLSPEAMALIQRLIETRGYRDAEAVVEEALHILAGREPSIEDDEDLLHALVAEGDASGEPVEVDLEALRTRLKAGLPWRG